MHEPNDMVDHGQDLAMQIEDSGNNRQIKIEKRGFPDAVLWNPWTAKSKGMSDFGDEEYKVCNPHL